ncbi:MAG: hypothetical protein ACLSB9_26270 [Hydrogeniiclostridium mannosilyticum]
MATDDKLSLNSFIVRIEELLGECECGHINGAAFISHGYGLLVRLYDLGFTKDEVYSRLFERYIHYMDCNEIKSDLLADLMDFVVGFCSPCYRIWDSDGKFDRK